MAVTGVDDHSSSAAAQSPGPMGPWAWFGIGAAAATLGLLPWLITGARLPLQNLWGTSTVPEEMPIGLLPGGCPIGLSIGAVAAGSWTSALVVPCPVSVSEIRMMLLGFLRWLPAIPCGVAIAWCGIDTIERVIAADLGVAATVIGPAFGTAVASAAGMRVLSRYLLEMHDHGARVFGEVLGMTDLMLRPITTVVVVAGVGFALKAVLRRRSLAQR